MDGGRTGIAADPFSPGIFFDQHSCDGSRIRQPRNELDGVLNDRGIRRNGRNESQADEEHHKDGSHDEDEDDNPGGVSRSSLSLKKTSQNTVASATRTRIAAVMALRPYQGAPWVALVGMAPCRPSVRSLHPSHVVLPRACSGCRSHRWA